MKTKIKEIQDYFLNKIYNCEFKIAEKTEHKAIIVIDEEYRFVVWIANGVDWFRTYEGEESFMRLDLNMIKSEKPYNYINDYGKPTESEIRAEKVALIEKLTKELNE